MVTLPAKFQRGRHTQAMYRCMELDDLIAHDTDGYVDLAVRLGTDATLRASTRERILERSARLFRDRRVIEEFERFFAAAVRG